MPFQEPAADRFIEFLAERLNDGLDHAKLVPELAKLLPRMRATPVLAARLLVHGAATFGVPPGNEASRLPPVQPDYPGIVFAGDQAATGWPSTMESAARAGAAAARVILGA